MALKLRDDPDLQVLHFADDQALGHLVRHLTHSESGQVRPAQSLLSESRFKTAGKEYSKVWDLIGAELQHYGGDSLVNLFRRGGVTYREILKDVCKSMWLYVDEAKSTVQLEDDLLASSHQLLWMAAPVNRGNMLRQPVVVPDAFSEAVEQRAQDDLSTALQIGKWMPAYVCSIGFMLILGEIRRGSLFTPVTATLLTDIIAGIPMDVFGPAFEVTTPAIFFVAYLRRNLDRDVY